MKQVLAMLGLSLVLASCGGNGLPPAPTEGDPAITSVSGTVTAGSGTGTITLKGASGSVLAQATVSDQGAFTLPLPTPDKFAAELKSADSLLSTIGCEGTLISSTAGTMGYAVAALQLDRGGVTDTILPASLYVQVLPPKAKVNAYAWVYADKATQLTGSVNCAKLVNNIRSVNIGVNAPLRAGWNVLLLQAEASTFSGFNFNGDVQAVGDTTVEWKTSTEISDAVPSFLRGG